MKEYFLFPNLTSSEWAAWIQAICSVSAIIAAAGIAIYQSSKQHKSALALHNREKLDAQVDIAKVLLSLAVNTSKVMINIEKQLSSRESISNVVDGLEPCAFDEILRIDKYLNDIPLYTIPSSLVTSTMILGSTVLQFKEKVEMTFRLYRTMDASKFDDFFKCLAQMNITIESVCNIIAAELRQLDL